MTRVEFKRQLEQLREVIHRALAYYTVWKSIILHDEINVEWTREEQTEVLGRWRGFFTPVSLALLDMALLQFAKTFDGDSRTTSLTNLLGAASRDPTLIPYSSKDQVRSASRLLRQSKPLLETLKRLRDQRLAHTDAIAAPLDPLLTKDLDKLTESVTSAFNALSAGCDNSSFSFDFSSRESARHTAEIITILLDHQARARQKFDDTMIGIGLDQLREAEKTIGGRVGRGDQRSVIETLGLTAEQMQRVKRAYNADESDGESR